MCPRHCPYATCQDKQEVTTGIPDNLGWREEAYLGRGGDGCNFICSTLKSSANTRPLSKPLPLQTRQLLQKLQCLRSCCLAARPPVRCQHNSGLVPGRRRQPQPKTQSGATPACCKEASRLLAHLPQCPGGRRRRTMGVCIRTGCPSATLLLELTPAPAPTRCGALRRGADGVRGCAQHPASLAGGTKWGRGFPGTGKLTPITTPCRQVLPWSAALERCPALCHALSICPSCLLPMGCVARRGGTQLELGAGRCSISMMLWVGDRAVLGRWVPIPAWGHVPGSSPLLQDSDNDALRHVHRAAIITQGYPPTGRQCLHPPQSWRFPREGRLAGSVYRTAGSKCCPIPGVGTSWWHLHWHTSSSRLPGLRGQGGPVLLPHTPHWALRTWQVPITGISGCRAQG